VELEATLCPKGVTTATEVAFVDTVNVTELPGGCRRRWLRGPPSSLGATLVGVDDGESGLQNKPTF